MAGSVNQNSRFDLGVRKVFFIPAPKIVLQQYRPTSADLRGAQVVSYVTYRRRANRATCTAVSEQPMVQAATKDCFKDIALFTQALMLKTSTG
jgi:hypothetical protein